MTLFRVIFTVLALLLAPICAHAQGQIGPGHVLGNPSAAQRTATDTSLTALFDRGYCSTSGAFPIRTASVWQCSTAASSFAHLGATADVYDFWIARPSAIAGTLLQMQDGKTGNLRTLTALTTGINFQSLIATTASGFSYSALSLDTDCQSGTGGGCVGINITTQASGTWTGPGGIDGVSPINTVGKMARGSNAWGANFVCWTLTIAANSCYAVELDVQNQIAGTAQASGIWLVNKNSAVPTAGSAALISATNNGVGFPTAGIYFSTVAGFYPLTTGATLIKSDAATVTAGVDLLALTITGNAFASTGFTVSGSGALAAGTGAFNSSVSAGVTGSLTGQLSLRGSGSGAAIVTVQAAAGTPTLTLGTSSGTPAVTASAPLAITAATGNIACATCATTTNGGALSATSPVTLSAAGVIALAGTTGSGTTVVLSTSPTISTTLNISGNTANIQILGGTGTGQGGYFGVGQAGLVHSVSIEKVILGGASTNLLFYADTGTPSGIDFYTNNINRIAIAGTGAVTASSAWSFTAGVAASSTTTGTVIVTGGIGVSGSGYFGANVASTTTTTGTVVITGGLGLSGAFFAGGAITASSTDATSVSTGAIQNPGGMSVNKRVWFNGITTSAGLQTAVLCQSSGGEVIADSVACLASSARFKEGFVTLNSEQIKFRVDRFETLAWRYRREPDSVFPDRYYRERIGLVAEDVAAIDPRLVEYDDVGNPRTIDYNGVISLLAARVRDLGGEVDKLKGIPR